MADENISKVIKNHLSQTHTDSTNPHLAPVQTEESEHKRQLHEARPLSSVIPKLPDWANKPLIQGQTMDEQISWLEKNNDRSSKEMAETFKKRKAATEKIESEHPIATGIGSGVGDFAVGMTSPENLALMLGAPQSKILSALFSVQALRGSYKSEQEAEKAFKEGKNEEATKYVTEALLGLGVAGLAGHHAVKDIPVPEPVKALMADESGFVDPIKTWPKFPEWFGNSKVVDEAGKPKVVYHGTRKDFDAFDPNAPHQSPNTDDSVLFFTSHPAIAETYSGRNDTGSNIKPVYLSLKNPIVIDGLDHRTNTPFPLYKVVRENAIKAAKEKGHDGIIVKNTSDRGGYGYPDTGPTDIYIAFNPENVKSAIGNSGTFDPKSGSLTDPRAPKLSGVKAKAAELKPTTAYKSADQSQPFYLKSENLISEKMKGPMPAEDVHKMLLSNGVKPEEMKWTGLDELLQGKGKNKVTPQEIQEHMAGNNLQVQEVTKGRTDNRAAIEDLDKKIEEINHKFSVSNKSERDALFSEREALSEQRRNLVNTDYTGKDTKFGQYVLPGGKNYRELLLTMPRKEVTTGDVAQELFKKQMAELSDDERKQVADTMRQRGDNGARDFRSAHWDEPNVLGHVRFNDRIGPNGEKILHIEELQSDWHQKGRSTRYVDPKKPFSVTGVDGQFATRKEAEEAWRNMPNSWADKPPEHFIRDERTGDRPEGAVPDAPFKKNWHELMLKRMLKYGAEHGYDGVSWTPGEQQAERYDLSKQVDAIHYRSAGPRMFSVEAYRQGVGTVLSQTGTPEELEGVVGKDIVRKMVAKEGEEVGGPGDFRKLTGVDLKVGGEGMKGFYDKIIPDAANKLGKQWGAKVGEVNLGGHKYSVKRSSDLSYKILDETGKDHSQGNFFETKEEAQYYADALQKESKPSNVPYLPITPQMRAGVKSIPYSLFTIPLAAGALSLSAVKARAAQANEKNVRVTDPNGHVHIFKDQQSADNFKREANIQ
jgi:hypothetical protein